MNTQDYQRYWQAQIDQCQAASLSGAAFCKEHGLSYHKFVYWRRKLVQNNSVSQPIPATTGFAAVVPVQSSCSQLNLVLPNGISITGFHAGNIELLGAVLRQL